MKFPPASRNRSRIANEVASSVRVPKFIAPRLSTLTSRAVAGSAPIVRYFIGPVCLLERSLTQACLSSGELEHLCRRAAARGDQVEVGEGPPVCLLGSGRHAVADRV